MSPAKRPSPTATSLPDARTRTGRRTPSTGTRPFSARSVIASTLLGTYPPRLTSRRLVRSCALFGIAESTARVALSRMLATGELTLDEGRYRLAGQLLDRQTRQSDSRRGIVRSLWDGSWVVHIVTADSREASTRSDLRNAMRRLHIAEFREGTWMRPDNLAAGRDTWAAEQVRMQCTTLRGAQPSDASALAFELFPLVPWMGEARRLVTDLRAHQGELDAGGETMLASAFERNAAVLRHLLSDPLLPDGLLPATWPGHDLRTVFERFDASFSKAWQRAMRASS